MKPPLFVLSILFLLLARISPALAFQFTPMSQVFAPSGSNATRAYQVINDQDERIAVEISVVNRLINLHGEETHSLADDDFLVYPTQMILEPGAAQVVRVSWLGDPAPDQELAYRLVAEQLPIVLVDPDYVEPVQAVGQIQILMRYMGSLFVRPAGVAPAVQIESVAEASGGQGEPAIALTLVNTGTASARLRDLSLTLTVQGQSVTLGSEQLDGIAGTTVLPGHSRRYVLPRPANLPQGVPTATFNYQNQ